MIRPRPAVALLALLTLVLVLAACTGQTPATSPGADRTVEATAPEADDTAEATEAAEALTLEEAAEVYTDFRERFNAENRALREQLDQAESLDEAIAIYEERLELEREFLEELRSIDWPDEVRDEADAVIESWDEVVTVVEEIVEAEDDEAYFELQERLSEASMERRDRSTALREALGIREDPTPAPDEGGEGAYEGETFSVSYELPGDWEAREFDDGLLLLAPDGEGGIFISVITAPIDPEDPEGRDVADVEMTTEALAEWLSTHPDLDAGEPEETTLGGLEGHVLDAALTLEQDDEGPETCRPYPCSTLFWAEEPTDEEIIGTEAVALFGEEQDRIWILEVSDEDLITVMAFTNDPADFEDFVEEAQPLLDSLVFE